MRKVTLCFLVKKNYICLAMKKRGFGVGKYNGVGGKVEDGESVKEAAVRELAEEIGVQTKVENLKEVGDLKFSFKGKPEWSQHMHIFFINKWHGEPQETEEMRPVWYKFNSIPFDQMWIDDKYWLPLVLAGKHITGKFSFDETGSKILSQTISEKP
jgi:8-oxo-dGTP pyrophosphatase MutT (NUDIX family)